MNRLVLGFVGEVVRGEVCSLCTFEALNDASLPSVQALEPGFEHARELMRSVKTQIACGVSCFLQIRRPGTERLFASGDDGGFIDKGELLAELACQGRCVLTGTQLIQHHP